MFYIWLWLFAAAVVLFIKRGINGKKPHTHTNMYAIAIVHSRYHCKNAARVKKRFMVSNLYQFFIFICAFMWALSGPFVGSRIVFAWNDLFTFWQALSRSVCFENTNCHRQFDGLECLDHKKNQPFKTNNTIRLENIQRAFNLTRRLINSSPLLVSALWPKDDKLKSMIDFKFHFV